MRDVPRLARLRGRLRALAAMTAAGLVTLSTASVPSQAAPARSAVVPLAGADQVAALAQAQRTGQRVRIDSRTTGTAEFFATPDGKVDAKISAGVVRFERDGAWVPVDLTLQRQSDGSIAPKAHPDALRLSSGKEAGPGILASVGVGSKQVGMEWAGVLAAPQLSGSRATYSEAMPGVDVVVRATATGFEQFFVVKSRAAAESVRSLSIPLTGADVASIGEDANGQLRVRDRQGAQLAALPHPLMWDSGGDGKHPRFARSTPLGLTTANPPAVPALVAPASRAVTLKLTPDAVWLADPDTVYPVTIDPQVDRLLATGSITVVQGYEWGWPDADSIFLGALSDTQAARALVDWDTTPLQGMEVTSARANFYNVWSRSCDSTPWEIWTTNPAAEGVGWDTQPEWLRREATSNETRCGGGWVSIDATTFFQNAALSNSDRGHMGIRAVDEQDWLQWNQFASRNNDASLVPYANVVYSPTPAAELPWTQGEDVAATDGSDVPVINPAEEAFPSLIEDPEAPSGDTGAIRYALGSARPLGTEESFEELGADPQLEHIEVGDEETSTPAATSASAAPSDETCASAPQVDGTVFACVRTATTADNTAAEANNPGGAMRTLNAFREGEPIDDGSSGDLNTEPVYSAAASRIPKPVKIPSECYNRASRGDSSWLRQRYSGCRSRRTHVTWIVVRNDGSQFVTGSHDYWEYNYFYTKRNSKRWVSQLRISVYNTTGSARALNFVNKGAKCSNSCSIKSRMLSQFVGLEKVVDGIALIESKVARGKQSRLTATWQYTFNLGPGSYYPIVAAPTQTVRCDRALQGYPNSSGCVVPSVTPVITYSLRGKFSDLAWHINKAHNSYLPGQYPNGTPLTKLNVQSEVEDNRKVACPRRYPRPDGRSCDEYPFASTYQGAAKNGGSARTHLGCGIQNVPVNSTGARGHSVCMIHERHNSNGGRTLQAFYSKQRLMRQDKFRVYIAP